MLSVNKKGGIALKEIKFRGKRLDNNEWVYGYYVVDNQWKIDNMKTHYIFTGNLDATYKYEKYSVDPETVEQFIKNEWV